MTTVVVDASVVMKWLLPEVPEEPDVAKALELFHQIMEGSITLLQPPHWLAEVGAVLTRLDPENARGHMADLIRMEVPVSAELEVYLRGIKLAGKLSQHLFDSLYHAVALNEPGAVLVTSDSRYYRKAAGEGSIRLLTDWN